MNPKAKTNVGSMGNLVPPTVPVVPTPVHLHPWGISRFWDLSNLLSLPEGRTAGLILLLILIALIISRVA